MEARGILSASVAGHSMGGAVAAQFAYDFPERVNKLIMIASAVYLRMPDTRGVLENIPRFISRGVIGLYSTRHHSIRAGLLNAYGDAQRLREEAVDVRARWMRVRGSADALVAQIASPRESDLPDALARIQAPTLLIWGDRDRVVPLAQGERLRETMPHAQLKVIETAGHIPHEECAAEVNGLMLDFLDQ
jgi:pimeloyl-ACP methyl ester carboxylesterase